MILNRALLIPCAKKICDIVKTWTTKKYKNNLIVRQEYLENIFVPPSSHQVVEVAEENTPSSHQVVEVAEHTGENTPVNTQEHETLMLKRKLSACLTL